MITALRYFWQYDYMSRNEFEFILLQVHWASWYVNIFHQILKSLVIIFSNILFFFSLYVTCYAYIGTLDSIWWVFKALLIFLHSLFFLFLNLDNLNWPIFKFADSFFCLLKSDVALLWGIFHFSYLYLNSIIYALKIISIFLSLYLPLSFPLSDTSFSHFSYMNILK